MPVRAIVLFPDPRLTLRATPVDRFGAELEALARDVRDTLLAAQAIGLTAPHIGVPARLVVTRMPSTEDTRVFVNPMVLWTSADTALHYEGSVSMPGVRERIARHAKIRFGYQDLEGAPREEEAEGFAAAVMLHEVDQLDGVFWIARLSRLKRDRIVKRFEKLKAASP